MAGGPKTPFWKRWWIWCGACLLLVWLLVYREQQRSGFEAPIGRDPASPDLLAERNSLDSSPTAELSPTGIDLSAGSASGDAQLDGFFRHEMRRWQREFGFNEQILDDSIHRCVRTFRPFLLFKGGREAVQAVCRNAHEEASQASERLRKAGRAFGRIGREDSLHSGAYLFNAIEEAAADWLQDKTPADVDPIVPQTEHESPSESQLFAGGGKIVDTAGRPIWEGRRDLPAAVNARLAKSLMEWIDEFGLSEEDLPALAKGVLCRILVLQPDALGQPPTEAARVRACDSGIRWIREQRDEARALYRRTGWVNLPRVVRLSAKEAAAQLAADAAAARDRAIADAGENSSALAQSMNTGSGIVQAGLTVAGRDRPALLSAPFEAKAAHGAQRWWSEGLKMPVGLTNTLGMKLVLVPAGEFLMGSTAAQFHQAAQADPSLSREWEKGEEPQHRVRISRPFYLGAHEVTRGQFAEFVRTTGYQTDARRDGKGGFGFNETTGEFKQDPKFDWQNPGFPQRDTEPVVNVSWNDANAFCEWLSRKERQPYRLPTEAEWEYACRAGTTTLYCNGDDPDGLVTVANVSDAAAKDRFTKWNTIHARDGFVFTAPVGSFRANAFGLFDMHGNVWEWCGDWFGPNYYAKSPDEDPTGPPQGKVRVFRGGSWYDAAGLCRSAFRYWDVPSYRDYFLGFRVAALPADR